MRSIIDGKPEFRSAQFNSDNVFPDQIDEVSFGNIVPSAVAFTPIDSDLPSTYSWVREFVLIQSQNLRIDLNQFFKMINDFNNLTFFSGNFLSLKSSSNTVILKSFVGLCH